MTEKPYKHPLGVVDLLEATNYATWKRNCGRILEGIMAWAIVVGEEQEPNNPVGFAAAAVAERAVYNDYIQRRAQAAAIIYGSCSLNVKVHLDEVSNPAEMWTILAARMDAANTAVGRMTLFRKFHALRPIAGQPINTYFAQLQEIKNQLVGSAEAISDVSFKTHIFTTLPSMFAVTVEILQSRVDITIQEVLDALKECEQNKAMITKLDAVSEALYSQQSDKGKGGYQGRRKGKRWCSWCRATSHDTEYCWKKDQDGNKRKRETDPESTICYYCGEEGHTQMEGCPVKQKAEAARKANSSRGSSVRRGNVSGRNGNGNSDQPANERQLITNESNNTQ